MYLRFLRLICTKIWLTGILADDRDYYDKCEHEICLIGTLGMLDYGSACCQSFLFCEISIREIYGFGTAVKNQIRKCVIRVAFKTYS